MIKAAFIDIDGTLLSHKTKCVPESARKALEYLRSKNVKVVACTGRHIVELEKLPLDGIIFDAYILVNGELCLDQNKKMIFGNMVNDSKEILKLFNEKNIPIEILDEDSTYINYVDEYVVKSLADISTPPPEIHEYKNKPFYQAVAFLTQDKQKSLEKLLPNCQITRWCTNSVDINSKGASKPRGIQQYIDLMGIKLDETISFGDGENDLEMIKYTKYSVAMGNGEDMVKKASTYVTTDVDDDGIFNGVKFYSNLV